MWAAFRGASGSVIAYTRLSQSDTLLNSMNANRSFAFLFFSPKSFAWFYTTEADGEKEASLFLAGVYIWVAKLAISK